MFWRAAAAVLLLGPAAAGAPPPLLVGRADALPFAPTLRVCGNYCGPGWCGGDYKPEGPECNFAQKPTDCADGCCQEHDTCCREDAVAHNACDESLVQCLVDCAPSFDPQGDPESDPGVYADGPGDPCTATDAEFVRRVMSTAINLKVGQCGGFASATVIEAAKTGHTHAAGALPLTPGGYRAWMFYGKGTLSYRFGFGDSSWSQILASKGTAALVTRANLEKLARGEPFYSAEPGVCCDARGSTQRIVEQDREVDACALADDGSCELFVVARCDNTYSACAGHYVFDYIAQNSKAWNATRS